MNKNVGYAIALLLALAAPFYGYPVFLMKLLCFALFACAFNLLIGYTGLLSFGHAAFFGGAGYVTGYALRTWGWPTELGLLAGVATGALLGLVIGGLAIRRQGIYFTMITLALALLSVGLVLPVVAEYLRSGLVPRLPTAVLATGIMLTALLSATVGLVLDTVTRGRRERKMLAYVAQSARR